MELIEIASTYNEDENEDSDEMTHMLVRDETWKELKDITTREIQKLLKLAMNKTTKQDFNMRLGLENFDKNNIVKFRHQCKNTKLRHIQFRLLSKDFFTMEKMLKYKMVATDKCQRCNEKETYKHLLWECKEAKKIWINYNNYLQHIKYPQDKIETYQDVYLIPNIIAISTVKMKIIQEMIQIKRPTGWTMETIRKIAMELKNIELYNSKTNNFVDKMRKKWNIIQ